MTDTIFGNTTPEGVPKLTKPLRERRRGCYESQKGAN